MSKKSQAVLACLVLSSVVACGAEPPPPPAQIVSVQKPAPVAVAPPSRARWVFAHPERGLNAKLDLGEGQTLFVGQYGRRALAKADGALVDAATLALEHLAGVLRDGADYVFVGDDGDIVTAQEPLGALGATRPGPLGDGADGRATKFSSLATGRASVLGITADGRVLRTADFGRHWSEVRYAGAGAFGHPYSLALDTKGNGLLIALPQRLYVTRDDGATWTELPSPGIGASWARRDGADRLFFQGAAERARLDGGQLVTTTEPLEPLRKPPPSKGGASSSHEPSVMVLAGERVVELTLHTGARANVEVTARKLGDPPGGPGASTAELVSARSGSSPSEPGVSSFVAGHGSSLLYARADDTKDADGAVTTTLLGSGDLGATWKVEGTFKGHVVDHGWSDRGTSAVAVGPAGFAFVRAMCPPGASDSSDKCTRRQVRPAGAKAFEDLVAVEDFTPMKFAFDEAHARAYVLGKHEGRLHVYESPLGQNKFSRLKLLDAAGPAAITVDPTGALRVLAYDWQVGQWKLLRHSPDGTDGAPLYGPSGSGEIALSGLRGIIAGDHAAWETADGGESWSRVAASGGGGGDLACTEAGCVMGGAERVGWELPAYESPERVLAQADPKKAESAPRSPPPAAPSPMKLACKPSGTASPVPALPALDSFDVRASDVRWSELRDDKDRKISLVVGGKSGVRELPLLAAEPPKPPRKPGDPPPEAGVQRKTHVFQQREGLVAARAVWTPRVGEAAPVDLELVWWVAKTGKVARRTLPKFKGWSIQRNGSLGEARIVDGGVLFQSTYGQPVHFLRDDGKKDQELVIPSSASLSNAVRVGERWVLPLFSAGTAKLTFSDGSGADTKWTTKTWRLDEYATLSVVELGGKPHLAFGVSIGALPTALTLALLPLDALGDDPPAPVVVPLGPADVACDVPASSYRATANLTPRSRPLEASVENADKTTVELRSGERIGHPTTAGSYCAAVYRMSSDAFVYAEPKGYSGVRFRRVPDPKEPSKTSLVAEPLACTASKP